MKGIRQRLWVEQADTVSLGIVLSDGLGLVIFTEWCALNLIM